VPSSPIAAEQHAALLTIDTACHGLRGVTCAIDCFAGGGALIRLFHINRLSNLRRPHRTRGRPSLITFMRFDYFHARPIDLQYSGNALSARRRCNLASVARPTAIEG
jgi:hypothetical protein